MNKKFTNFIKILIEKILIAVELITGYVNAENYALSII